MRPTIGNGWSIWHLTDRTIELRKESADYRRLCGRDGYVAVRCDEYIGRAAMIDIATEQAQRLDDELARRLAAEEIPTAQALRHYQLRQQHLAHVFGTPEDPEIIGRKRP